MGIKLGNYEFKHGLWLAPMAGYTDRAMRLVCHKYGAEFSVSEMVSAKAVVFGDKKTYALANINLVTQQNRSGNIHSCFNIL